MSTGISYCDETVSPVHGCTPVSPGCRSCFAAGIAHRFKWGLTDACGEWTGEVRLVPKALEKPLRWRKPRTILWETMGDVFHDDVPNEYIAACFGVMAATGQHTHLVLTKRIERVPEFLWWLSGSPRGQCVWEADAQIDGRRFRNAQHVFDWPLPNVLIGTTVENQARADERLPPLGEVAAMGWRTWISVEPMIGLIDLDYPESMFPNGPPMCCSGWECGCHGRPVEPPLMWPAEYVVVGGETGPGARPCDVDWIRSVVEQCRAAGVRVHVKQLTGHRDMSTWPEDLRVRDMPR